MIEIGDTAYLDLLRSKVDFKTALSKNGFNPVAVVCKSGNVKMMEYLSKNANINFLKPNEQQQITDNMTCLHLAI